VDDYRLLVNLWIDFSPGGRRLEVGTSFNSERIPIIPAGISRFSLIFVIANRMNTIRAADIILVVNSEEIIELGSRFIPQPVHEPVPRQQRGTLISATFSF
jgi:hypothetical protein